MNADVSAGPQIEAVKRLAEQGLRNTQIAERLGISVAKVDRILGRNDVVPDEKWAKPLAVIHSTPDQRAERVEELQCRVGPHLWTWPVVPGIKPATCLEHRGYKVRVCAEGGHEFYSKSTSPPRWCPQHRPNPVELGHRGQEAASRLRGAIEKATAPMGTCWRCAKEANLRADGLCDPCDEARARVAERALPTPTPAPETPAARLEEPPLLDPEVAEPAAQQGRPDDPETAPAHVDRDELIAELAEAASQTLIVVARPDILVTLRDAHENLIKEIPSTNVGGFWGMEEVRHWDRLRRAADALLLVINSIDEPQG